MAIIVDDKPTGPPKVYALPSEGMALIVLADVEDLGLQENEKFGQRREVALTWVVNEQDEEGSFFVIRRKLNASMNEGSNLYGILRDMYGKNPPKELDLEKCIGRVNIGAIKHTIGKTGRNAGKQFANINTFYLPKPTDKFTIPADFVRAKDGGQYGKVRKQKTQGAQTSGTGRPAPAPAPQPEIADEDIPF